jgi:hypothetical protein
MRRRIRCPRRISIYRSVLRRRKVPIIPFRSRTRVGWLGSTQRLLTPEPKLRPLTTTTRLHVGRDVVKVAGGLPGWMICMEGGGVIP